MRRRCVTLRCVLMCVCVCLCVCVCERVFVCVIYVQLRVSKCVEFVLENYWMQSISITDLFTSLKGSNSSSCH